MRSTPEQRVAGPPPLSPAVAHGLTQAPQRAIVRDVVPGASIPSLRCCALYGLQLRGLRQGKSKFSAVQAADRDRDGRLTGKDAVAFFERSGLPKSELAKVWSYSDSARKGYLDQTTFQKVSIVVRI